MAGLAWNWAYPVCSVGLHPNGQAGDEAGVRFRLGVIGRVARLTETVAVSQGFWGWEAAAEFYGVVGARLGCRSRCC